MYVIMGRGGVLSTLLALPIMLVWFLWVTLRGAAYAVACLIVVLAWGMRSAYRAIQDHRARKQAAKALSNRDDWPKPGMSPVE